MTWLKKIVLFCIWVIASSALHAQRSWNLVWREDFGVTADTVIRDFVDDSKQVIDHTCAASESECTTIDDMYYGIANSTWWAYNRFKSCGGSQWHFMGGRDHTGNEKGAMLIVNVGNNSLDKQIYEQTINFDLCQNTAYRFVIYAASITNPSYCNGSPTRSNLTMNVYNVKDPSNPILLETLETGDVPLWEMPLKDDGDEDWGTTNNGFGDPFGERQWSEYAIDFIAGDGDKLKLEVVNHKNGGCGNDFVIDDISLYRYDENQIIDPTISTSTVSQESVSSASGCSFFAKFSVSAEVLESWEDVYSQVYFLWQRSTDDGVTWTNIPEPVSGIKKNTIEWEVPEGGNEVYRVIITGSTTAVDAKTEAEYIAEHGGPSDGCSYFSISNTLAGVSPEPDCSYYDDLKTIWKEDFGVIDSSEVRSFDGIGSEFSMYESPSETKFEDMPASYVVTCAPDKLAYVYYNWNKTETYYEYKEPKLSKFYTPNPNEAVLYIRSKDKTKSMWVDKLIQGPFCNCKNYIFSFKTIILNQWSTMKYKVYIKNAAGTVLETQDIEVNGAEHPTWHTYSIPFSVDYNYSGAIRLQIEYQGNENWAVPVAFDDFRVSICQEKIPQASLHIDNDPSLHYLTNFDCSVSPPHIVYLEGVSTWTAEYPNYAYVWQMSTDGGDTWTTISESNQAHYCDDLEDGETLFRVVVGENQSVAQQVAANGKPNDPCSQYLITNVVGLNCKGVTCTKPATVSVVSSDVDKILCPGGSTILSITEGSTVAGSFDYLWFKDEVGDDGDAMEIGSDNTSTYTVDYADAGTYVLLVRDATQPTARKCWEQAEIEISATTAPKLKSITGGATFCYGTQDAPQITYTFEGGTAPYEFSYKVSTNGTDNSKIVHDYEETTFSPTAPTLVNATTQNKYVYTLNSLTDSYGCSADVSNVFSTITVNPVPTALISEVAPVCEGSNVTLVCTSNITGVAYEWTKGEARTEFSTKQKPTLSGVTLSDVGPYYVKTSTANCTSAESSVSIPIYKKPRISEVTPEPTEVCSGEDITFTATIENVGDGTASYSWTGTQSGSTETLVVNKSVAAETTVSETLEYTIQYNEDLSCSATSSEASATIHKIPEAPDVSAWSNPVEYCKNDEAEQLSAVGTSLTWYLPDGTTSSVAPIPPTNVADETYTYQVTQTVHGCESEKATITVVVYPLPNPVITSSKDNVCYGVESVTLGLDGVSYVTQTWTGANVSVLSSPTTASPTIAKLTTAGTYEFGVTVTDENGCSASATQTKSITIYPKPIATITPEASGICNLTSTVVNATVNDDTGTGAWTNANENSEYSATFTASSVGTSTVKYVYTSAHSCKSDEVSATIQVYAIPAKPVVANKSLQYCVGNTAAMLTATPSTSTAVLAWYDSEMTKLDEAPTPSTASDATLVYFVTQTDNACTSDTSKITIRVLPLPTPEITADADAVCKGENIALSTGSYSKYAWSDGGKGFLLNSTKQEASLATTTIGTSTFTIGLTVTDSYGCSNVVPTEKTFVIYPIPNVTISAQQSDICNLTSTTITASVDDADGVGTGVWTNAVEVSETSATYTAAQIGTHEVSYVYTSTHNCVSPAVKTSVVVHAIPAKPTVADKNIYYCKNASTSPLSATPTTVTASLLWYDGDGNELAEAPTPSSVDASTTYYAVKQVDNECASDTSKITVTVHPLPSPVITVSANDACKGAPVALGLSGVTYASQTWSYEPSSVSVLSDPHDKAPVLLPTTPVETYSITVEVVDENNCKNTAEHVTVTLHPLPTASITIDESVCVDGEAKTANVVSVDPAGGIGTFSASGNGVIDAATGVFDPAASGPGEYTISYDYTSSEVDGSCRIATPATATIRVIAKPTVTLKASKSSVCESGSNSDVVTMMVETTPEGGSGAFSCSTAEVNETTGSLTPSHENIGSHTIKYVYKDLNQCENEVSTVVTVHELPNVKFDESTPSEICYKSDEFTLSVSPTSPGVGTFSGAVSSSLLNPSVVGAGENQKIVYTYVDEHGCINSAQHSISIVSVSKPTIDGGSSKMIVRGSDGNLSDNPDLTAVITTTGDGILWQRGEATESDELLFVTGLSKDSPEGTYTYTVVESREIIGGTCYSDDVVATVVISDCPAKTPLSSNEYYCVDTDETVSLTAEPADGTLTSGNKISWFNENPTGLRDPDAADLLDDNQVLTLSSYDVSQPSERIVYVAEYDAAQGCWSGGRPVTIKVIANPVVMVDVPTHVCGKDGAVLFKMVPATGTLRNVFGVDGFDVEAKQWTPIQNGTKPTIKCPIEYTVIEYHTYGSTTKSCQTVETRTITAHFITTPTVSDKTWLIGDIAEIPDDYMEASTASTGKRISWYSDIDKSEVLNAEGTKTFTPDRDELLVEAEGKTSLVKSYYASQTDNYGCESDLVEAKLSLLDCPWAAPTAQSVVACQYDETIPALTATADVAAIGDNPTEWIWYESDGITLHSVADDNGASSFAHGIVGDNETSQTFWVSYKAKVASVNDRVCESPKTPVTVTVNKAPEIEMTDFHLCHADGEKTLYAFVNGVKSTEVLDGTWSWSVEGKTGGIDAVTGIFNPSFEDDEQTSEADKDHAYQVTYSYTDTKNCSFKKTVNVDVEYAQSPTVTPYNGILSKPDPVIVTAGNIESTKDSYTVNWYYGKSAVSVASNENPWTISELDPTQETTRSYWVSQTVDGCESERVEQKVTIVDCPYGKPLADGQTICAGGSLLDLTATTNEATPEKWVWYNSDGTVIDGAETSTYHHSVSENDPGTSMFSVSYMAIEPQSGELCESQKAQVSIVVLPLPSIELEDKLVCHDEGSVLMTVSSLNYHENGVGTGTWSVKNETNAINDQTGIFNTDVHGKTTADYTVVYTYKDGKECENSAEMTLTVQYVPEPDLIDHASIVTENIPPSVSAQIMDGAEVNWFGTEVETISTLHDKTWIIGLPGDVAIEQTYYASQTYNGCESEKAPVSVKIVECPFSAPDIQDVVFCVGETDTPDLLAETSESVVEWKWYDALKTPIANTAASYAYTVDASKTDTTRFYVNYIATEPVTGRICPSDSALANVIVLPLPEITFDEDNPSLVCVDKAEVTFYATVDVHNNGEGSGSWSVENHVGAITSVTGRFVPSFNGNKTETYTIRYDYIDLSGCENHETQEVTVKYVKKPTLSKHYAMTTENKPVVLEATDLEDGAVVRWYTGNSETRVMSINNPWTTSDKGTAEISNKLYYASQVVDGCESQRSSTTVDIVPCPVPNVVIESAEICEYDEAPVLHLSLGSWNERNDASSVRIFDAENTLVQELSIDNLEFTPTLHGVGTYEFYAEEYNTQPYEGITAGCASPSKTKTTVVVKTVDAPVLRVGEAVCYGAPATPDCAALGKGEISWYEENPGDFYEHSSDVAQYATGSQYNPLNNTVGTHSVWALCYAQGCYSKVVSGEYTIHPRPEAPNTEGDEVCFTGSLLSSYVQVTDALAEDSHVAWYSNKEKQGAELGRGVKYVPYVESEGEYTYYAAITENGCEGEATPATIVVKPLPGVPQISGKTSACTYDVNPEIRAEGENITWYASDKSTVLASGKSMVVSDMKPSTNVFYATQTVDGCEGQMAVWVLSIYQKPLPPTPIGASICAGSTDIPMLSTNLSIDKWYADEYAQKYLSTGYTYLPESDMIGNSDVTFYVVREQRGCYSDTIPVVLRVIQKPTFSIGNDTTICVYDSAITVKAVDFVPPITESSFVGWSLSDGKKAKVYGDNEEHSIIPGDAYMIPGEYTVRAFYRYKYDNVSCNSDTISMHYAVKNRARTPIVFTKVICKGEEIKDLRALGSPNMTWVSLDGLVPPVANGPKYKFQPGQVLDTGTYHFEVYDIDYIDEERGCLSLPDTVSMTVAPGAETNIFGIDSVCMGQTETYYTQYTKGSTYYWNVTGDNLNYSKDAMSSSVHYVDWIHVGYDTLSVYEQTWAGCEGYDTVFVKVVPVPKPSFTWTMPGLKNVAELVNTTTQDSLWRIVNGDTIVEPVTYTMYWNFGHYGDADVIDSIVPYERRNFPIREENYEYGYNCPVLTVENDFGCKDSYIDCFFVNIMSALHVPNAFAPANPAHSVRKFSPQGFNLKTCEVSVYDHWGNLLWFSNEVEDGKFVGAWDGTYDGKMMEAGVYVWKIEATFIDGQVWEGVEFKPGKKRKFGNVVLIR